MLSTYRLFVGWLVIVLPICFAPRFTAKAVAEPPPNEEPVLAPPQRPLGLRGVDRFNQFAKRHRGSKVNEEDLEEIVELVRAWRMMKEVGLTEAQSLRFLNLSREMKKQCARLAKQRERAQRELKKLFDDPQVEDGEIAKQLEKLEQFDKKQHALRREYERKMTNGLTTRQRAKLRLFRIRFERDMRRLIERIRQRHAGTLRDRPWGRGQPSAPFPPPAQMPNRPVREGAPVDH